MAANKRPPEDFNDANKGGTYWRYMKLSKADWADAYADLYRQVFGEDAEPEMILVDAEKRVEILAGYRKAGQ